MSVESNVSPDLLTKSQLSLLDAIEKLSLALILPAEPNAQLFLLEKTRKFEQDHWVASVLLDTSKASVNFRVHFATLNGRHLLATSSKSDPLSVTPLQVLDYLKEYCNLVMGHTKAALAGDLGKEEGQKVFLPKLDPSYDLYRIIPTGLVKVVEERWWSITWPNNGELFLYARVKSDTGFHDATFKSLAEAHQISIDNAGEVEFL